MPRATWTQTNFNGGEWSPLTHGRVDLSKYKNGLAQCQNYVPTAQGGLTRRPGSRYVAEVKNSANPARIIPFQFSVTQAYVLEFGPNYIRFYANDGQLLNGGVPYEISTPYAANELFQIVFAQSADTLYIAHQNHPPMKLQRFGATNWQLNTINFLDGPYLPLNTSATTLTPSGTSGTVTVTASGTAGINNGAGFQSSDVGSALRIKCGAVWLWGTIASVTSTTQITWTIYQAQAPRTAVIQANCSGGSVFSYTVVDGGAGYGAQPPTLGVSAPNGGSGGSQAVCYPQLTNGSVSAVVASITGTSYNSATVTVGNPAAIPAQTTTFWRLGVWGATNGYPAAVVFNQDRLIWAGPTQYPNRIDGSNVSDYENLAPSSIDGTVADNNAISFTLNANEVNAIRWMVSDEWGLLVGTAGAEWVLAPNNTQAVITPTNVQAKMTTSYGCAQVQALRVGKSTLFVQRTQRKLREMTYQFVISTYQAPDISLVSEHLTKGGIKQIDVAMAPQQTLWMCRNDGTLVGIIYDKDQDLNGWHQHQMGGWYDAAQTLPAQVESIACIPDPTTTRDELWVLVNRNINGANHRYVEVLTKYWEDGDALTTAVFLDASSQYSGAPTTTVSGLTWLIGQTVGVLADGSVHPDCVVSSTGSITLQRSASTVQVGLKYTSTAKTLRIEAGGADGPAQGKYKRIHRAILRFFQSVGLTLTTATSAPAIPEPFRDSSMLMDNPVGLFTGDKRWSWEGSYDTDGQITWSQTDPLPSNILLLSAQLETQDGG
ncbi:gp12 [Burkholderia lata]|uniref:Gp12 n=1 Tax=Burkholderia lata (strain ATCC 17760 / DSM 23089 / LMG 22485 / NCIMB 9086 / R18194 / 383) TaxID=482957 RepID=A0A6P2WMY5_BURL3|nr:hypothetical protein [Burkholderia lata]VWC96004.1 gp12 [Burkholderia lata]